MINRKKKKKTNNKLFHKTKLRISFRLVPNTTIVVLATFVYYKLTTNKLITTHQALVFFGNNLLVMGIAVLGCCPLGSAIPMLTHQLVLTTNANNI